MQKDVVTGTIKSVIPTPDGCAVFIGSEEKTIVIYIDKYIGKLLTLAIEKVKKERPFTHDLVQQILTGLGADLERVVINDFDDETFYARLILKMENELGKNIVEIDARPSDSMVLATQADKPIYMARAVIDQQDDMTEFLEQIRKQQEEGGMSG